MAIKNDGWIKDMAMKHGMIKPFEDNQIRNGKISYGLSSYGYDIRVANEYKIFTNVNNSVVDPKILMKILLLITKVIFVLFHLTVLP